MASFGLETPKVTKTGGSGGGGAVQRRWLCPCVMTFWCPSAVPCGLGEGSGGALGTRDFATDLSVRDPYAFVTGSSPAAWAGAGRDTIGVRL